MADVFHNIGRVERDAFMTGGVTLDQSNCGRGIGGSEVKESKVNFISSFGVNCKRVKSK